MNGEEKIPVPNTVGEMIEFLKKFPKNASLHTYKEEGYYCTSETESYHMSVEYLESGEYLCITFH